MFLIAIGVVAMVIGVVLVRSATFESYSVVLETKGEASKPALDEAYEDGTLVRSLRMKMFAGMALAFAGLLTVVVTLVT